MNNSALGFNPDEVKQTVREIRQIFDEIYRCNYEVKNGPLNNLEGRWYAPEAVEFGRFFNDRASTLGSKILFMERDLSTCIFSAYNSWSIATQSPNYSRADFEIRPVDNRTYTIVSEFVADKNGFVGITDVSYISTIISDFSKIYGRLEEELGKLENTIVLHDGFVGGEQSTNLQIRVREAKASVALLVEEIKLQITNKVKETEQRYTQTAQANAQRFSSGN